MQHPADDPNADQITTHFEYHSMEENLLKLDMLGHDDPTMIRMMEDMTGVDAKKIPLDDKDTMSILHPPRYWVMRTIPSWAPPALWPSRNSIPGLPVEC